LISRELSKDLTGAKLLSGLDDRALPKSYTSFIQPVRTFRPDRLELKYPGVIRAKPDRLQIISWKYK